MKKFFNFLCKKKVQICFPAIHQILLGFRTWSRHTWQDSMLPRKVSNCNDKVAHISPRERWLPSQWHHITQASLSPSFRYSNFFDLIRQLETLAECPLLRFWGLELPRNSNRVHAICLCSVTTLKSLCNYYHYRPRLGLYERYYRCLLCKMLLVRWHLRTSYTLLDHTLKLGHSLAWNQRDHSSVPASLSILLYLIQGFPNINSS
jgi:hypothetical protein